MELQDIKTGVVVYMRKGRHKGEYNEVLNVMNNGVKLKSNKGGVTTVKKNYLQVNAELYSYASNGNVSAPVNSDVPVRKERWTHEQLTELLRRIGIDHEMLQVAAQQYTVNEMTEALGYPFNSDKQGQRLAALLRGMGISVAKDKSAKTLVFPPRHITYDDIRAVRGELAKIVEPQPETPVITETVVPRLWEPKYIDAAYVDRMDAGAGTLEDGVKQSINVLKDGKAQELERLTDKLGKLQTEIDSVEAEIASCKRKLEGYEFALEAMSDEPVVSESELETETDWTRTMWDKNFD